MRTILSVVALALAALLVVTCGSSSSTSSSPAAPDKSGAPAATAAPATKAPAAKQTLLDVSGSGAKKTQAFKTAGDWDINWSAKDTSEGVASLMQVFIYDAKTNVPVGAGINTQIKGEQSDVDHEHTVGSYYLSVNAANCDWHITVTG